MILEQNKYNGIYYAIYKNWGSLIGFIGDEYIIYNTKIIEKWMNTKVDYYIIRLNDILFDLDPEKDWIGFKYSPDTSIDEVKRDLYRKISMYNCIPIICTTKEE